MKKIFYLSFVATTLLILGSCKKLNIRVSNLEKRVTQLEELCSQMNADISALQTIVTALQDNDYVTSVVPVIRNGEIIGYTITFTKSGAVTIYNGQSVDGWYVSTPIIGIRKDSDDIYYWTLNGEWLVDNEGHKIKAEGRDGENGKNGNTPKLKIDNSCWYVSYDNEETWQFIGEAESADPNDGDYMFEDIDTSDPDFVIFYLSDGTQIKLPTWYAFEELQRLCNQTNTNIDALQALVDALQNRDYITGVEPLTENGKIIGYTIKFAKSNPVVIYNGKDGQNGSTPEIGVKKDIDGLYYWTINGEFITVDGQKIVAQGKNGDNGTNGVTPQLKIEDGYWYISYNEGGSWEKLDKATGEDGKDADSIEITQDEDYVYFKLSDGTTIKISKHGQDNGQSGPSNIIKFEDETVKNICIQYWDTDFDRELSYDEAAAVTTIDKIFSQNADIQVFSELKYFTGLTSIDAKAFKDCTSLWHINIPANVTEIDISAFNGCKELKRVVFEAGSKLKKIAGEVVSTDYSGTFKGTALVAIEIPASVETIEPAAFYGCEQLRSVTFEDNSNLKLIDGKHSYSDKRCGAFAYCTGLTTISIPASVETIGECAFFGCSSLQYISFEQNSQLKLINSNYHVDKSYGPFSNLESLISFDASNCKLITQIGQDAFEDLPNLVEFKIGTITPPDAYGNFTKVNKDVILYVPEESIDKYQIASFWKNFTNIKALE